MSLIVDAHAKINWALNIVGTLPNGYHALDMLMQSIALCDTLRLERAEALSLTVDGAPAADAEDNLVVRAARALNARCGTAHGARIDLVKRVPSRAGLGGGSADCAAALTALNRLWGLGLSRAQLLEIGAALGADVPFCLTGGLARVSGFGEIIEPVSGAPELPLVLVTPGGGLSTGPVFKLWDTGRFPPVSLDTLALAGAVLRRDLAAVDRLSANALTAPAMETLPEIGAALEKMRALGAGAAFMTGSGSTVVGVFDGARAAQRACEGFDGAILTRTIAAPDGA